MLKVHWLNLFAKFSVTERTTAFQDDPCKPVRESSIRDFIAARTTEVVSGDNWSYKVCKAPAKSSLPTNQHRCLPSPNHVRALKGKSITALDLRQKKLTSRDGVLHPYLDHRRLLLIFGMYCQAYRRPYDAREKLHVITF